MDGITKVFLPLNAETCDFSGSLEQVASMLFANTTGLVYKPSSGISTGYSADKVSLDNNGKPLSDNLYKPRSWLCCLKRDCAGLHLHTSPLHGV